MSGPNRSDSNASSGELPTSIIVAVSFVTVVFIGAVTMLILLDKPVDNLMLVVGAYLAPTITSLLASKKLGTNSKILGDVKEKVDGTVDNLITDRFLLEQQVNELGDTPVTFPARRATDTKPQTAYPPRRVRPRPYPDDAPTTEIESHGR